MGEIIISKNEADSLATRKIVFESWEKNYSTARIMYSQYNADSSKDEYILRLLEKAMLLGLTYRKSPDKFFDSSKILARLYFKYQSYQNAENHLLLLRDLSDDTFTLPAWVYLYSAITFYKLSLSSIVNQPFLIMEAFDTVPEDEMDIYQQKQSAFHDFLIQLHKYFDKNNNLDKSVFSNISKIIEYARNEFSSNRDIIEYTHDFRDVIENVFIDNEINVVGNTNDLNNSALLKRISEVEIVNQNLRMQLQELKDQVRWLLSSANRDDYPKDISSSMNTDFNKSYKVLIYGASQLSTTDIFGIAKSMGYSKDNVEVIDEYDKKFDFRKIRFNSPYDGILIGPVPHSLPGKGNYSSIIEMLKNEEGYPHVEEIKTYNKELKITKTSLKEALKNLRIHLDAIA